MNVIIRQSERDSRQFAAQTACSIPDWHQRFLELLPAIQRHARHCFRGLSPDACEEAVQEVVAKALIAYVRLVETGKEHVAFATPLARYAVAQVRDGRHAAGRLNVRDVLSVHCRRRKGVIVERLDSYDDESATWESIVVEDRRSTPAEIAATRIDFRDWLRSLSRRNRRIATKLAMGETTNTISRMFRITAGRVSQLRRELKNAWHRFHGGWLGERLPAPA